MQARWRLHQEVKVSQCLQKEDGVSGTSVPGGGNGLSKDEAAERHRGGPEGSHSDSSQRRVGSKAEGRTGLRRRLL